MTGPTYPPPPQPGSNAIGSFIIGQSPVGDISPTSAELYFQTIISQYANSATLVQLIRNFWECIDQTQNLERFFDLIWNVDTAVGYGLDVWGRIVGVSRVIQVQFDETYFGFQESSPDGQPFGQAPFFLNSPLTENFALPDSSFRLLIFAKALANISDGSIRSINQLLLNLFPNRGNCYVTDGLDMTMAYTFEFALTAVERSILAQTGVLPKPVGVSADIVIL